MFGARNAWATDPNAFTPRPSGTRTETLPTIASGVMRSGPNTGSSACDIVARVAGAEVDAGPAERDVRRGRRPTPRAAWRHRDTARAPASRRLWRGSCRGASFARCRGTPRTPALHLARPARRPCRSAENAGGRHGVGLGRFNIRSGPPPPPSLVGSLPRERHPGEIQPAWRTHAAATGRSRGAGTADRIRTRRIRAARPGRTAAPPPGRRTERHP